MGGLSGLPTLTQGCCCSSVVAVLPAGGHNRRECLVSSEQHKSEKYLGIAGRIAGLNRGPAEFGILPRREIGCGSGWAPDVTTVVVVEVGTVSPPAPLRRRNVERVRVRSRDDAWREGRSRSANLVIIIKESWSTTSPANTSFFSKDVYPRL